MSLGCCSKTHIVSVERQIDIDTHSFLVNIVYCNSCGSVKATSNIKEQINGNKTKH